MNRILDNKKYIKNLKEYSMFNLDWDKLNNKTILVTGATGLIGRFLIDLLMYKNFNNNLQCNIVAMCRSKDKASEIFDKYLDSNMFKLLICDVRDKINDDYNIDYIIHAASNTYPIQYATDPVGTITTSVMGTYNLLEYCSKYQVKRFIYISSFEVYGTVNNVNEIMESDFGFIDCTILRSCYPEGKRTSESLCIAFSEQKNVNTSIVRLSRVFGPTMNLNSSLATAQFIKNSINNTDIVLKSNGEQMYSYNYVGDAVTAILTVLLNGKNKEAYNVSDNKFDAQLRDFAGIAANISGKKVIFDLPDDVEKKGFSNSTRNILNSEKIKDIGWSVNKNLKVRIKETIDILK